MKRLQTFIFLLGSMMCVPAAAQNEIPPPISNFAKECNRLFDEKRYDSLRLLALNRKMLLPTNAQIDIIAALALFYQGDSVACWDELAAIAAPQQSDPCSSVDIYGIQPGSLTVKHHFFGDVTHRYRYLELATQFYGSCNHISHPEEARKVFASITLDQYLRALIETPLGISAWYTTAQMNDSMRAITDKVYDIYKTRKRIFSREEIGAVWHKQFLLLAHEPNVDRRAHYQSLLEQAARDGICGFDKVINFQLRTERNAVGSANFRKTLNSRIAALKKKYDVSDYQYSPF
jgi:hypothetical protein